MIHGTVSAGAHGIIDSLGFFQFFVSVPFLSSECAMPIYAYRCAACGFEHEALQKVSEALLTDCPSCGKPSLEKQVTAAGFQLKGSGWYVTDFRDGGKKPESKSDSKSGAGSESTSAESTSSDSKSSDSKSSDSKSTGSTSTDSTSADSTSRTNAGSDTKSDSAGATAKSKSTDVAGSKPSKSVPAAASTAGSKPSGQ